MLTDWLSELTWAPWPKDPSFEYADFARFRFSRDSRGRLFLREIDEEGTLLGGTHGPLTLEQAIEVSERLRPELKNPLG